jgi:hypothetical protein
LDLEVVERVSDLFGLPLSPIFDNALYKSPYLSPVSSVNIGELPCCCALSGVLWRNPLSMTSLSIGHTQVASNDFKMSFFVKEEPQAF